MNSKEVKEEIALVIDDLNSMKKMMRSLDATLSQLCPVTSDEYVSLSRRLEEDIQRLWNLRFQDLTGLDKLSGRWTDEQIAKAKAAYDVDPTHSVTKSDDSYSTWTEYIYWDSLPTLDKNDYLREYFKEAE